MKEQVIKYIRYEEIFDDNQVIQDFLDGLIINGLRIIHYSESELLDNKIKIIILTEKRNIIL
jgi:hypothetical protein